MSKAVTIAENNPAYDWSQHAALAKIASERLNDDEDSVYVFFAVIDDSFIMTSKPSSHRAPSFAGLANTAFGILLFSLQFKISGGFNLVSCLTYC